MTAKTEAKPRTAKPKKRHRIKVDLSEWELGDWGERIGKLVEFENDQGTITITLNIDDAYENLARTIVREGLETFFNGDGVFLIFTPIGLAISSDEQSSRLIIPYRQLFLDGDPKTAPAAQEWLEHEIQCRQEHGWPV